MGFAAKNAKGKREEVWNFSFVATSKPRAEANATDGERAICGERIEKCRIAVGQTECRLGKKMCGVVRWKGGWNAKKNRRGPLS